MNATDLFAGGGEMGALMRAIDWHSTKLGPVEGWPQSLRTMLGVMLGSRFPMLLWWGPDLLHLYNDAYRPILRDKHPSSLAAPAAQVWAEVWDVAGPMARSVQEGGPATWTEDLQLFITSGAMAEETYFTFSYSPVPGDDGRVGGVLNTVQETTVKVQGERQIRMLHDVVARAADARTARDAYRIALEVLGENELDLPFVLVYLVDEIDRPAQLIGRAGWDGYTGPAVPSEIPIDPGAITWPIAEVIRTGDAVMVDDLAGRFGELPVGRWGARPERAKLLPLFRAGQSPAPAAVLVAGISPHRSLDDRYRRFFRATADQMLAVVSSASAFEAENRRAEALAQVDHAKTTFFNNVSHEFRTPLTLILGPIEDALGEASRSLDGDRLEAVHRSALRLLHLVNSLLDFARIEAGHLESTFVPTDLATLTEGLVSSFRSLLERAGLNLVVDCPVLPEPVHVDASQWEKVVFNLLSNAYKFTFEGTIAVSLAANGDQVELTVSDTGIGIPDGELPRMFDRFHRVEGARGRSFEGTGIGLSMVREIARLHGGTARVDSVLGKGSTFVVSIPTGSGHLAPQRVADAPVRSDAAAYPFEASLAGTTDAGGSSVQLAAAGRVLVVDDNADLRHYLRQLLSPYWNVELADDGEAGLAIAFDRPPDLIVSDVMMPGLDGLGLVRRLREDQRTRDIPIILLSARSGGNSAVHGLDTGADDYLIKPFSARELIARVRSHLQIARTRRQWASELERAKLDDERRHLTETNRLKNQFVASMSHELRTPLNAIVGFASILHDGLVGDLDSQQKEFLGDILSSSNHLLELIGDILDLAKVEAGRLEFRPEVVEIGTVVAEVRQVLHPLAEEKRVQLEATVAPALGVVVLDPGKLKQVLYNYLSNALKFAPSEAGRVCLRVGVEDEQSFRIEVEDNGSGIRAEDLPRLFVEFQQLDLGHRTKGTGLGLALTKRLVEAQGGSVGVRSELGHGTTFFAVLPRHAG